MNYRQQWFRDNGLPFEPPKLGDFPPFKCVGGSLAKQIERPLRPASRPFSESREPGEAAHG